MNLKKTIPGNESKNELPANISAQSFRQTICRLASVSYRYIVILSLLFALGLMGYTLGKKFMRIDFTVFYWSARMVINGMSPYAYYGKVHLPFWYFPWVAWIFIPFAIMPSSLAWIVYIVGGLAVTLIAMVFLARYYPGTGVFDRIYIFSIILWMSWLTYYVGQMSFFLFGFIVLFLYLVWKSQYSAVGLCFPLLLLKPHLLLIFIPAILLKGGKKTIIISILSTVVLLGIETLITPNWLLQMIHLLGEGTQRVDVNPAWGFTTFTTLIGFSQNYAGTSTIPLTLILIAIAAFVVYRFRRLSAIPWLSLALAASLFCAPRSYSYDLILLVPAIFWLSEKWSYKTKLMWGITGLIPLISLYSTGSYLLTLLIFGFCIYKAYCQEKKSGSFRGLLKAPA
jgi:hypothetical protein